MYVLDITMYSIQQYISSFNFFLILFLYFYHTNQHLIKIAIHNSVELSQFKIHILSLPNVNTHKPNVEKKI